MDYSTLVRSSLVRPDSFRGGAVGHGHVPFGIWLIQSLAPKLLVKLGALDDSLYFNFCNAVRVAGLRTKCYAIDYSKSNESSGHVAVDAFADAQQHNECLYPDISSLLYSSCNESAQYFSDASIDLLIIAGAHSYEAVTHDFAAWLPKLTGTAVVMIRHTNVRERGFGVWRFWEELALRYPLHLEFVHASGLGVFQLMEGTGSFCLDWLHPESADRQLILDYFSTRDVEQRRQCDSPDLPHELSHRTRALAERDAALSEGVTIRHELAKRNKAIAEIATLHHEVAERDARIADLREAAAERDAMAASISWRITRPLRLAIGVLRGEAAYRARLSALIGRNVGVAEQSAALTTSTSVRTGVCDSAASVPDLLASALPELASFMTYPDLSPDAVGRLTLIIRSLDTEDLSSGVDTAILLAVVLARHRGLRLRVVSRDAAPQPLNFSAVLAANGLAYSANVEFEYSSCTADARALADTGTELIMTTTWSTTWAALRSFDPSRIIYLVHDDERLFYPAGDLQLRCREILCDTRLCFVVKTSLLRDFLVSEGMIGIAKHSIAFEPAFPSATYFQEAGQSGRKRRFLFYARPGCPGHLFLRGLEAVAGAIEKNVFSAAAWEFFVLGSDIPSITLPGGIKPTVAEGLPWQDISALMRQVDVCLALMYGPQLSDPVLAFAASGAVVVSSRFGPKQSLDEYCANIVCIEPSLDALVAALGQAAELAANEPLRQVNYVSARINRDWESAFAPLLDGLPR